jgi:hypothetical protein
MAIFFRHDGQKAVRFIRDFLIVDYDDEGIIIGAEVVGCSYLSGRPPIEGDMIWLKSQVIALGCDIESDTLSIQIGFGNNFGQKKF